MRAEWDVDGIAARGRAGSIAPLLGIVAFAAVCAIGVSLCSLGGSRWGLIGLAGAVSGAAVCAWMLVYRRLYDATLVLLTLATPLFIDVELIAPHGWSYVPGWPQGLALKLSDIFLVIAAVAWFFDRIVFRGESTERLGWVGVWAALFVAGGLLFPIHSVEPSSSAIELGELARFAAIFALLAKRIDNRWVLKWVLVGIAVQVWVQAVISTLQYALGSSLGLEFLGERPSVQWFVTEEGFNPRAGGLMGHPNNLALFLTLVGPLILAKTLTVRGFWARVGWGSTYLVLNEALLLTFSRFGWMCAVASFFVVYHLVRSRAGQPLWLSLGLPIFTSVVVFAVLFVSLESFRDRLLADDRGSVESRFDQFKTAISVISHWPIAGTGIGAYSSGAYRFVAAQARGEIGTYMRVHNGSLLVMAEMGLLAALGYHAWFFSVLRRGWAPWRYVDPELAAVGTGVFVGLVAWFAKSMYNAHTPIVDPAIWLFAALMIAVARFAARDSAADDASRRRPSAEAELLVIY